MMSWKSILTRLLDRTDLLPEQARWAMTEIIQAGAAPAAVAGFLIGLRAKGETPAEIAAIAEVCLEHAVPLPIPGRALDIVGTGGDRSGIANVSTMAAIVVAGLGILVVKHGGRGASSSSGAADTIEALGIPLNLSAERLSAVAEQAGITFCFAPAFHPGLRHAAAVRAELGVPTVLNVVAPLLNPARPQYRYIGVAGARHAAIVAEVLARRGTQAVVVSADDGLDKLSTRAPSSVWLIRERSIRGFRVDPSTLDIPRPELAALRSSGAEEGAAIVRDVMAGRPGPLRDIVLLNAAAALMAVNPDSELAENLARCAESIDSGAAAGTLQRWIEAATAG